MLTINFKNKKNITYSIPVLVIDIKNGGILKIKIACDTKDYKKDEIFNVNYKLLNSCSNEVWDNLVKQYNKNI